MQRLIKQGSMRLEDANTKSPVFTRQMSKIGEQGYRAAVGSPGASDHDVSEIGPEPEDAELNVTEEAHHEIVTTVDTLVRRNSLKRQAL